MGMSNEDVSVDLSETKNAGFPRKKRRTKKTGQQKIKKVHLERCTGNRHRLDVASCSGTRV